MAVKKSSVAKANTYSVVVNMSDGSWFEMSGEVHERDVITISSEPIKVSRGGSYGFIPSPPRLKMDVLVESGILRRPKRARKRK